MARLYLFFQGNAVDGGELWWLSFDGTNWDGEQRIPNVGLSFAPSPVVWNNRLHVFHQGGYENGQLWYTYFGDNGWVPDVQVQPVGMSFEPSTVVYNNNLYVFHQWAYQNGELCYKVYDGTNWLPDTQLTWSNNGPMAYSPSAVVWNNHLYVFFQSGWDGTHAGTGQLCYKVFDGTTWLPDTQVPNVPVQCGFVGCAIF